jgi:hypothetical protein
MKSTAYDPPVVGNDAPRWSSPRVYRWRAVVVAIFCIGIVCIGIAVSRNYWLRTLGNSLVSQPSLGSGEAILIDNVETNYLLFERAQRLEAQGLSALVLVPVLGYEGGDPSGSVPMGFVDVMCGISRLKNCTTFGVPEREPISLNVAKHCAEELRARGIHSVIIVTEGFRSRRAAEIYLNVFKPLGITVYIQPVFGHRTPENWYSSWHGVQEIGLQFAKLWYYRLAVL